MKNLTFDIIENAIPHGAKKQIAIKAGVSYPTVLRCFNGTSDNEKVLAAALEIYKERQDKLNEIKKLFISNY